MNQLYLRYRSVSIFSGVAEAVSPLAELTVCKDIERRAQLAATVFRAVAESGCDSTGGWIRSLILSDDNVFSRAAAKGERIDGRIKSQVKTELTTFKQLSLVKPDDFITDNVKDFFPRFGFGGFSASYDFLASFYAVNGCGRIAGGNAFTYRDGALTPIRLGDISLSDLKDYAEEKSELVRNTESFIAGLPAFHALLYGDRGTGKSATVRAIANEYRDRLKIIEIARNDISRLPQLKAELAGLKQKFIIFIDGLEIDESADESEVKAALESALDADVYNTIIYCTSDRRLASDADRSAGGAQAELALFDRFGLVITYVNPDKERFVDILKQILRSRGVRWHEEYAAVAELAALKKGVRSPRAAKQIADIIESAYAEKRGA